MEFSIHKDEGFNPAVRENLPFVYEAIHNLLVTAQTIKCAGCGKPFDTRNLEVHMYDHDGGWYVRMPEKQWLSIPCTCGYHTSFSKLGIK